MLVYILNFQILDLTDNFRPFSPSNTLHLSFTSFMNEQIKLLFLNGELKIIDKGIRMFRHVPKLNEVNGPFTTVLVEKTQSLPGKL